MEYTREPSLVSFTVLPFLFRTVLVTLNGHCRWRGLPTSPCIIEVVSFIILERYVELKCAQAVNKEKINLTKNEPEEK